MTAVIETLQQKLDSTAQRSLVHALSNRGKDFVWFGGSTSQWTIVPLGIEQAAWSEFVKKKISNSTSADISGVPFTSGYIGVIPYEEFSPFNDGPMPILMQAKGALLCDNRSGVCTITAKSSGDYSHIYKLANELLEQAHLEQPPVDEQISLTALSTNQQYEEMIDQALNDIRAGRYYQINLLRFFGCSTPSKALIAELLVTRGGPYSCWITQGDTEIASFSPEHFVAVSGPNGQRVISTSPIKGTSPRFQDPTLDKKSAQDLLASQKNLAELHMIIDLMRNDLNRICRPGTVQVKEAHKLVSFVNVHHLVGAVSGRLRDNLAVADFLQAICPGGSITGAPKIEVMHAIRAYEGRPRGFFMGHAFMLDEAGSFNSSILIRTLQKVAGKDYEFSAGSGIVIHSDPKSERLEIDAKCNVLKR